MSGYDPVLYALVHFGNEGDSGVAFLGTKVGGISSGLFVDVDACHPGTFASAQDRDRTTIADRHLGIR